MAPPGRRAVGKISGPSRAMTISEETTAGERLLGALPDQDAMRREIDTLRAEVKELRKSVEMLLSAVMDGEPPRQPPAGGQGEENPPFYN